MEFVMIPLMVLMFFLPFLVQTWVVLSLFVIGCGLSMVSIDANEKLVRAGIAAFFLTTPLALGMVVQFLIEHWPMISGWFTAHVLR